PNATRRHVIRAPGYQVNSPHAVVQSRPTPLVPTTMLARPGFARIGACSNVATPWQACNTNGPPGSAGRSWGSRRELLERVLVAHRNVDLVSDAVLPAV